MKIRITRGEGRRTRIPKDLTKLCENDEIPYRVRIYRNGRNIKDVSYPIPLEVLNLVKQNILTCVADRSKLEVSYINGNESDEIDVWLLDELALSREGYSFKGRLKKRIIPYRSTR